jgi:PadR family transcriptional regulator AphA
MSIEYAILGLLSLNPLSGYDIKKMFEGSVMLYWSGNNNQIYTSLVKLHKQDLVSCETQIKDGSPTRKIYNITEKGLTELRQWALSKPELPEVKNSFLIQLAWADMLTPTELEGCLKEYENDLQMQLAMLRVQKQQRNISPSGIPRDAYINVSQARTLRETYLWNMILENWIAYYQTELNWILELRNGLQGLERF